MQPLTAPSELTLEFLGPYLWRTLEIPPDSEKSTLESKGVYLWTVEHGNGYLIYLAGWTGKSFVKRFADHRREYRSGVYTIFDPREFVQGRKRKLWRGAWYTNESASLRKEFQLKRSVLEIPMKELWESLRVYLAPLFAEDRMLERIEAAIVQHLYRSPDPVVAGFPDKGMRLVPRRREEPPARVSLKCAQRLHGMPMKLEV